MSDALLNAGDFNVITVDWGNGSSGIYSQSASNTRLVGLEVAHLIAMLHVRFQIFQLKSIFYIPPPFTLQSQFSVSPSSFHLIGHSLGSHIAGYAGEKLNELVQVR